MPEELDAVRTPVTRQEMAIALFRAYHSYFGAAPSKDSVRLLLAHWALETGWGKGMWCYNVGNAKSRKGDDYNYCYFECNEILSQPRAELMQKRAPKTSKITTRRNDGSCIIWFFPKHPWCRFRAFESLDEGVYDHLKLIVNRFGRAWDSVLSGDPVTYSKMLRSQGYYTADESHYTKVLKAVYDSLESISVPTRPLFTRSERKFAMSNVTTSLRNMVDIYPDGLDKENG